MIPKDAGKCYEHRPAIEDITQPRKRKHHVNDIETYSRLMPKKQTIAERLKAAREKLNLSQAQAAEKWEVEKQTLQSWEQGRRTPTGLYLKHVEAILKKAGV